MSREDSYRYVDYRRMIDWGSRLKREVPFLAARLGAPDGRLVVDFGCGPGEHARALADEGFRLLGLDRSLEQLRRTGGHDDLALFAGGDLASLPLPPGTDAAGAICLGNTLVHIMEDDQYRAVFRGIREVIGPGGPFIVQILNYVRLREKGIRHLPLNFREGENGGESVFLRLLDFVDHRSVRFEVITLERGAGDEPARVARSTDTLLRALRHDELECFLRDAGFEEVELFGSYDARPFEPLASTDVIAVAR